LYPSRRLSTIATLDDKEVRNMPAKLDLILPGFSLGTDQGSPAFCGVTLIEGTKRILVDVAHYGRRQLLLQKLQERGLTPDDIDYVFLTHAHWDHSLNADVFPNSKFLIHRDERQYIKNPPPKDWATPRYISLLLESQQLQEVTDGEEIDDGVRVMATPGHSIGSMALIVDGTEGKTAVCGDALPNSWSVRSGMPRLVFYDVDAARKSIQRLLDEAKFLYPGHDRPFELLDGGKTRHISRASIHVFGWPDLDDDEGGPGISFGGEPERAAQVVV
jgi:glyoxylase-like metal-dependent hydrolase (beta-lactamase superfamily II)